MVVLYARVELEEIIRQGIYVLIARFLLNTLNLQVKKLRKLKQMIAE